MTVAYSTCDRPGIVERGLTSYIDNIRGHGHSPEFVVFDDTAASEPRQHYRELIRSLSHRIEAEIRYVGREERDRFAEQLIRVGGFPPDIIKFALLGQIGRNWYGSTLGANRNALLLHTVGSAVLSVDDDTACQLVPASNRKRNPAFVSDGYPLGITVFRDRQSAINAATYEDIDLLGTHQNYLGADPRDCFADGAMPDLTRASTALLGILQRGSAPIRITLNGILGDSGWGSPANYMFMRGEALERIVQSEQDYQAACTSRNLLQMVDRVTISDAANEVMMMCVGLENVSLLPPFFPIARGQDIIFGTTMAACCQGSQVAYLPWAVLHLPVEERSFWPGEVIRSASGLSISSFFTACLRALMESEPLGSTASRLRRLGKRLEEIAALTTRDYVEYARLLAWRAVSDSLVRLDHTLETRRGKPDYWAKDVRKFMQVARESATLPDFHIPLDLRLACNTDEAAQLMQEMVRRFGLLLYLWPDLVDATKLLQQREISLVTSPKVEPK
jgi:hypothetical protein